MEFLGAAAVAHNQSRRPENQPREEWTPVPAQARGSLLLLYIIQASGRGVRAPRTHWRDRKLIKTHPSLSRMLITSAPECTEEEVQRPGVTFGISFPAP